jgi:hypothetical protein
MADGTPRIDWMFNTMEDLLTGARTEDGTVMDGAAFERFLEWLRKCGELVLSAGPEGPVDRADGFRNILAVLRTALDRTLGNANPYNPSFSQPWLPHLFDWGGAAPDCVYRTAPVRGDAAYRILGTYGNSPSQNFQLFGAMAPPGAGETALDRRLDISTLTIEPREVEHDADGSFELFIGGAERLGNWFPLHPGATTILSREFFSDPAGAIPSKLAIECLDPRDTPWPVMTADRVTRELDAIGEWLYVTTKHWIERISTGLELYPNAFEAFHRTGTPLPAMSFGFFRLEPDEALVVEFPDPDSAYWDIQMTSSWFRTYDFANRLTSFTGHQAVIEDGIFRAVLSPRDPGVPNWLDSMGYRQGVVLIRIAHHKELHVPETRVVRLEELESALPPGPRVDPEARRAQIEERRRNVVRLLQQ